MRRRHLFLAATLGVFVACATASAASTPEDVVPVVEEVQARDAGKRVPCRTKEDCSCSRDYKPIPAPDAGDGGDAGADARARVPGDCIYGCHDDGFCHATQGML
jgi:hypothetical protein